METCLRESKSFFGSEIGWQFIRRVSGRGNTARVEPLIVKGKTMNTDRRETDAFATLLERQQSPSGSSRGPENAKAKESTGAETHSQQPSIRSRLYGNQTRYRITEGQARQGARYRRGNAKDVSPLMTKCERHPAQLVQPDVEKRRIAWRSAVLVPILKKGKCATVAESYRLISITSVISKTMERMMNALLYNYLEQSACLDESQSGFRKPTTTVDQLVPFTQSVINAWQAKSPTAAVFVDLEKAYDRVWRTGLQVRLQEHGITGRMHGWLKAFLTERLIRSRIKETLSRTRPLANGLP
ncbi:RNA-directed DNA polymerase from [Plakobranchus ocellatus]|uniref:RNA-directed DNA polymerase from n=1 Tax=Plakobranchus ocellatus TaxID=259542 RepID=A0AAV3YS06_9GAST|nr:RNA-directed DNA polymerase from [Plakobranchus ocellatus]